MSDGLYYHVPPDDRRPLAALNVLRQAAWLEPLPDTDVLVRGHLTHEPLSGGLGVLARGTTEDRGIAVSGS
jgi:hypothetical protein